MKEVLEVARELGWTEMALTDINNTSGSLEFVRLAPNYGIRPVVGVDFRNGADPLYVGLAQSPAGWQALNGFLSRHLQAESFFPAEAPELDEVVFIYPYGQAPTRPLRNDEFIGVRPTDITALALSDTVVTDRHLALNTASFRHKRDHNTHRLLRAIDQNCLLSMLPTTQEGKDTDLYQKEAGMETAFSRFPTLITQARAVMESCSIDLSFHTPKNKRTFTGSEEKDAQLLRQLCYEGLEYRYPVIDNRIRERLEKELAVIQKMGFMAYFLINWDIVRYARSKGYFYVGRGSGANSIAAFCLQITDVDPIELDLYFERFINLYRSNAPDFDIDFSWKDRDDVTRYIFEKHGLEHTALLATYHTFQRKAVIRELGKVFGLPKGEIDQLIHRPDLNEHPDHIAQLVLKYSDRIKGLPSHLSIHAGGILISEQPIHAWTATSLPPKGYPLVQFSMIEAEDLGLYKFDILSQRGLGHLRDAMANVYENQGQKVDIHRIRDFKEDEGIKEHLRTGRTLGCFYVESPAMRMLLTKLEAQTYTGLVAASSIIRPGVSKSGMMREYILRYRHPERRNNSHPVLQELMAETYGIMVYQEDVIKVAHYFAGLTLAEADVLRRGMTGKYRSREEFQQVRDRFFANCQEKGYPESTTREVWDQIASFANYSFSKGHSASYAVESYQSLYLKAHFPLEFMVGGDQQFWWFLPHGDLCA